jgi:hypothetical protein
VKNESGAEAVLADELIAECLHRRSLQAATGGY